MPNSVLVSSKHCSIAHLSPLSQTSVFNRVLVDALLMKNFFSLVLEQSVSKGKLGVIHAKVEHQVPVTNEKMRIKTMEGNEKWVLTTIYSLDAKSPVPYKHLVTLVETQAPEHV